MDIELLKALLEWQGRKKDRCIDIKIGSPRDNTETSIWCYDYEYGTGKHITTIEELNDLDLRKQLLEEKEKELEYLKNKFSNQDINESGV